MSVIHLLDSTITSLIAAGEVVERPSSVVKELVENSIDAKATRITVEIFSGGRRKIQVSDNGIGMSSEDSSRAFLKHATSKIEGRDDLCSIKTLGFRGEALYAISAVSKVKLVTKRKEDVFATETYLEGGQLLYQSQTAAGNGTTISVENLFYNTPARYKFLKAEQAETGAITSLLECLALSHPEVSFRYFVNGTEKFYTAGNGDILETIYLTNGKDFKDAMLPVSGSFPYKAGEITVSGFCGKPLFSRSNRNKQYFFVNGRYIKSKLLQNSLENAYKSYIMTGRYPVCFLYLTIDPSEVDINVHPNKIEAKFSDERVVYNVVTESVSKAIVEDRSEQQFNFPNINVKKDEDEVQNLTLSRKEAIDKIISDNFEKKTDPIVYQDWTMSPSDDYLNSVKDSSEIPGYKLADIGDGEKVIFKDYEIELPKKTYDTNSVDNSYKQIDFEEKKIDSVEQETLIEEDFTEFKIIGECFDSYIIVERGDEISFIDKHALHERMNFEKLKSSKNIASQSLLTPVLYSTSADNYAYICENTEKLKEYGFEVEDFGDNTVLIRTVPEMLDPSEADAVLEKFASVKTDSKKLADAELFDIFLYDIACKASIKAGRASSDIEIEALISDYMKNKNNLKYCPHGRPIEFVISKKAMEKQFKRIV